MGAPVTGWANGEKAGDGGSIGYIVGIDLQRQGSLLKGFPLHLSQFDFGGSEPEGCPLVVGDKLFVTVAKRDNVGLRRSVAAFDRFGGQLIWKSPALAIGTVEGSDRANLLSHQLLTMEGGRLFYNTNLGSVACLDPLTGQIEWLVRYRRHDKEKQAYPRSDRFRYRDLNPCVVHGGLVYCSPQDCPEVFALDALTGDLVWSTDDSAAGDAIHILGVTEDHLIVSGDRLIWLDRRSGRVDARFPAAGNSGTLNSLPSPRGLGRGMISAGEIYWPTANEIIVFATALKNRKSVDAPPMQRRIRLDTRGSEGGNLVAADGWLLVATPSRLMAFAPQATTRLNQ
jgi:outer membrane protein assembly factor BamB